MEKAFLIARSNLRRSKGQTAAMMVLILLAALMMNLWLMLSMDYKRNFERYHEKLNGEHVTLALNGNDARLRAFLSGILEEDERTVQYCMDDCFVMVGSFAYGEGEVNTEFVVLEKEAALNRPVGKIEVVEEGECTSGIYLPMIYGTDYSVGETIELTIGSSVESYTVCGFLNSIMTGSHNCSMTAILFTEDKYEELEQKGILPGSLLVSVRIRDRAESKDFEAMIDNAVASRYPDVRTISNSYDMVSTARYISQMICSGIVSAMAFLVTLIALVVISSNVINYIQEDMRNLGALKAVGYTSSQIISALLFQFLGVVLVTATVGSGLSYCLFPAVNQMMVSQTGIPYTMRFLPLPFVITLVFLGGIVFCTVWLSSRRIKKIEPITMLRLGVLPHSFKRNHVPLERTHAPLTLALALKNTLSGVKQNITVCVTMLVLSLVVVFSGLMAENVIVNMEPFVNLIVGETADLAIDINVSAEDEFLQLLKEEPRVRKVYLYNAVEVRHFGGNALVANLSEDFSKLNNQSICVEGRLPKYDNEMAVAAKYAKENGLNIGDEITLAAAGNEAVYIICGFTQISNYLGEDCMMLRSGYERMGRLSHATYYINMAENIDIDAFNAEVGSRFGNDINTSANMMLLIKGTGDVYVALVTAIVIAILILSGVVITFVLYLLVRMMLNRKKRDYGVMKALGFTTGQLILQTAASFMPAVIISTVTGLIVNAFIINPLMAVFLSGIGIVKCTYTVPAGFISIAGVGLIGFSFGIVVLLSLKIRRVAPRALIVGE